VSLPGRRFAATLLALWALAFAAMGVLADAPPPSTWVALKALPQQGRSAIFALAVDPTNNQAVIAGNSAGALLKSTDGATTWNQVYSGKTAPTAIVFSPFKAGVVLAGTRGAGALLSRDGGTTWSAAGGLDGRVVRAFAFARTLVVAGTDKGVFLSQDGSSWSQSGLADRSIDAIAVAAVNPPVRILAGSDGPLSAGNLQMYQTIDGGATWTVLNPPISGTFVVELAASPLPPTGAIRRLIAGTNAGLFASSDNATSFVALSGGSMLPSTDYTRVVFITDHFDRFYAASDGGGSRAGGLWRTNDGGQNFLSLEPPMPSVTALAVSNDESPTLYVATFRPSDHVAALWVYRDTGGTPQSPFASPTPVASGSRTSRSSSGSSVFDLLKLSQAPYVGLGVGALLIVLLAAVAHLRGRRH
jgi:photosystem II stability/assembly factor-like uncharacterized protein